MCKKLLAGFKKEIELKQPILKDQTQYPTNEVIYSCIGDTKKLWISFFEYIHRNHPDFTEEWKYYKDGKSWLLKTVRKSKTIFWTSVSKDAFQISFYFTDKVEETINNADISDELKEQFKKGKHFGKLRALTIVFRNKMDIEYAKSLIVIKLMK